MLVTGLIKYEGMTNDEFNYQYNCLKTLLDYTEQLDIKTTTFLDRSISLDSNKVNHVISISINELDTFSLCQDAAVFVDKSLNSNIARNSKTELLTRTLTSYPAIDRISWIDPGVVGFLQKPTESIAKLRLVDRAMKGISIPGHFPVITGESDPEIWRFLGSFITGNREQVYAMHRLSRLALTELFPYIPPEVCVWSYMENSLNWISGWYYSNFSDSIFDFPMEER